MNIKIARLPITDPRQLSQCLVQIVVCLDMFNAELARVLRLQCADIGQLTSAQRLLLPDSEEWRQAEHFVEFYTLLDEFKSGDSAAMCHWLRAENPALGATPHHLIVDEDRLIDVVSHLREQLANHHDQ